MGDVGVDIFFREIQLAWDELDPFRDEKARRVDALVRADLAGDHQEIRDAA
jgi:hypothetical protein